MLLNTLAALVVAFASGSSQSLDISTIARITYNSNNAMVVSYNNGTADRVFATADITHIRFSDVPEVTPPTPTTTDVISVSDPSHDGSARKIMVDGQLRILLNGKKFTIDGKEVSL